jgi:hypothetical protein
MFISLTLTLPVNRAQQQQTSGREWIPVDSLESQLWSRQTLILGTTRKVHERENTDHILDSTHKLAILITLNKALLYIVNFFTAIY